MANKCTHKGCRTTAPCRFETYAAHYGAAAAREALARANEEGGNDFPPQTFPV